MVTSDQQWDRIGRMLGVALTVLALALAFSSVYLVYRHWHKLDPGPLLLAVQISIGLLITAGAATGAAKSVEVVSRTIRELRIHHAVEVKVIKRATPALFAGALLAVQVWMLVGDKAFPGDEVSTVLVGVVSLVLFAVATHLGGSKPPRRYVGWALWFFGLFWLPAAICLHRQWWPTQLIAKIAEFQLGVQVVIALSFVIMLALPAVFPDESAA